MFIAGQMKKLFSNANRKSHILSLGINWTYTIAWILSAYLVYFVWKPSGYWDYIMGFVLLMFVPEPVPLFQSYESFERELASERERQANEYK